jgi:hypothetical protein
MKQFTKNEVQMANKYIQKCSTSVAIKGNANQNDNEILSYPSYNGNQENKKMLVRMWGKSILYILLVGM